MAAFDPSGILHLLLIMELVKIKCNELVVQRQGKKGIAVFILEDALSVWTKITQTLVRLVMRKDGHKANYALGRIIFRFASSKTYYKS